MKKQRSNTVVYVIDDGRLCARLPKGLLGWIGLHVRLFDSADAFCKPASGRLASAWFWMFRLPGLSRT